MKKLIFCLTAAAAALATTSCEKEENPVMPPVNGGEDEQFVVLTFEDADYKGGDTLYWSSLVDSPEYGGQLLYGEDPTDWMATDIDYEWTDTGNTGLSGGTIVEYGFSFSFGGLAVSNYVMADETAADYTRQLSLWSDKERGRAGHNGSANFCICYDGSAMLGISPAISFADGSEHVVDHLYVANIAWTANSLLNIETEKGGADDRFGARATGYDANGEETGTVEILLFSNGEIVRDWIKWDLSPLGRVSSIEFKCFGTIENLYGLATPAYFAIDDVAVAVDADEEE